jgi:hypothetical protein
MKTAEERFYEKVDKHGPYPGKKQCRIHSDIKGTRCHKWMGWKNQGYGQFCLNDQQTMYAHRFSYELAYGKGSLGKKKCCHKCDRTWCVNPLHLFKGTDQINTDDKLLKGRNTIQKGEAHGMAKLKTLEIRVIRSLHALGDCTYEELGKRFHVSAVLISSIVRRIGWRHVR